MKQCSEDGLSSPSRDSPQLGVHLSSQHQADHFVVTHERPKRVLKSCRFVFLDEEVTSPGSAVTWNQCQRKKPPLPDHDKEDKQREAQRRTD